MPTRSHLVTRNLTPSPHQHSPASPYHQTPVTPPVAVSGKPASIPRSAPPDNHTPKKEAAHEHIDDAQSITENKGRERETSRLPITHAERSRKSAFGARRRSSNTGAKSAARTPKRSNQRFDSSKRALGVSRRNPIRSRRGGNLHAGQPEACKHAPFLHPAAGAAMPRDVGRRGRLPALRTGCDWRSICLSGTAGVR